MLLVGCYSPSVTPGGPSGANGACPTPLVCVADVCVPEGTPGDAAPPDGLVDATDLDAAVDVVPVDGPTANGWAAATAVPGVNTGGDETDPSQTPDRLTLVFARNEDLMIATRAAVSDAWVATSLTALDTASVEGSPELDGDGTTLYFVSDRLVAGDKDVYVSTRTGEVWSAPVRVDELSTTGSDDDDVAIAPDRLTAWVKNNSGIARATRSDLNSAWGTPAAPGANFGASNPAGMTVTAAGDLYLHAGVTRDLFIARASGTGFAPRVAITELNTTGREAAPAVSADEHHLVFERDGDLYESAR